MTPEELQQKQIDCRFSLKDRIDVLRWVMDNPMGRQFIWWLLGEAKIFSSTLAEHHVMAYQEGRRSIGLKLFALIQADRRCEELFSMAKREHNKGTEEV